MDKNLFNSLFDREIHNPDFLRGRVASCIKYISDYMVHNIKYDYNYTFFKATTKYNKYLIRTFGLDFISFTLKEIKDLKKFLVNVFNSDNVKLFLKENDYTKLLTNFDVLCNHIGYKKRSRIFRRYNNFICVSNKFLNGKLNIKEYREEILNHIIFFDDMLKKFENVKIEHICIYYFVYDIRASENVRKLKQIIKNS